MFVWLFTYNGIVGETGDLLYSRITHTTFPIKENDTIRRKKSFVRSKRIQKCAELLNLII